MVRAMNGSTRSGSGVAEAPRLSVVMPVYDVAPYLPEALDSVLGQSFDDLEVVVVDDGSTDESSSIAAGYAQRDPRVRVVRQQNAGLGAARNAGVAHAQGCHLTFADGDDVVPPGSYEAMMAALERTGSDMVVGTLERLGGRARRMGRLMRENHARRREGVTLAEMPQMLADVFAVNKVFRRSFWDEAGLSFPVGTRYEDQPTMTRAFLAAERFDVLAQTVYLWRRRDDQSSITQNRHHLDDLRERMETKRTATRAVMTAHPELSELWFGTILPIDLWSYFEAAACVSDDYWRMLRDATREFWNDSTLPFTETRVPVHQRLMGWLVVNDRRDDLTRLVEVLDARSRVLPLHISEGEVVWRLSEMGLDLGEVPASTYRLAPHELEWETRILDTTWDDGVLTLHGFALNENVPTGGRSTTLTALLAGTEGARETLAPRPRTEPRATKRMGRPGQDFHDCGFEVDIDVAALVRRCPPAEDTTSTWRFRFERTVDELRRAGGVTGYRTATVDRSWHQVCATAEARLRDVRGSLVLDIRRTRPVGATSAATETVGDRFADSQSA
jgi:glycosyltransferase involved in cell wall biosynthesis